MPRRGQSGTPGVDGIDFDQEHWRHLSDLGDAAGSRLGAMPSWPGEYQLGAMPAWPRNGGPLEELRDVRIPPGPNSQGSLEDAGRGGPAERRDSGPAGMQSAGPVGEETPTQPRSAARRPS
jgi:hypothetical protein